MKEFFDRFYPPGPEEAEMARLLDLIAAEWSSDPTSTACFDIRIIQDVRKALENFKAREIEAKKQARRIFR